MKLVLNKKEIEKPVRKFIVLNEYCQVFCGLKQGLPAFSDDIDDAKPLENQRQVEMIQRGTLFKLEKSYL
jgi:hypothetical protein|tara:strand:+ start:777 stop:986 length:210 start_codon:yes stop_codon:yes gene_type:complete